MQLDPPDDFCRCDDGPDEKQNPEDSESEGQGAVVAGGSAVLGASVGAAAAPAAAQGILGLIGFGSQGVVAGMFVRSMDCRVCYLHSYSSCLSHTRLHGCRNSEWNR